MSAGPLAALALALVAMGPQAVRAQAPERVDPALVGGKPSDDRSVVALVDEAGAVLCSGTLIRPHVVLTAAHCVSQSEPALPYAIVTSAEASATVGIAVVRRLRHPEYDAQRLGADLALLGIADAQDAAGIELEATPPADGYAGTSIRVVGYGCTDLADAGEGTGVRRTLDDTLEAQTPEGKLRHPGLTCVGDSGGPVLTATPAGDERLLAVTSSGGSDENGPFSLATPVAPYVSWVNGQADALESELSPPASDPSGGCAAAQGTSSSQCGWLILGLLLLSRSSCRATLCRARFGMCQVRTAAQGPVRAAKTGVQSCT